MKGYKKLGRNSAHRKSMLRNLVTDLFREGRITTTDMRAKEAGRQAEKLITIAKKGDLHARRQVLEYVFDEDVVTKLFDEIAPKYQDRNGGYTRTLKLGPRQGDNAEVVYLELVYPTVSKYQQDLIRPYPRRHIMRKDVIIHPCAFFIIKHC